MAERTVSVRLKAVVDDYKKAFGDASKATDDLVSKGDRIKELGKSTSDLGASLSRNVTLPIVALGGAAVKMATDFDSVFVNMQTLAGVSASEVDGLKASVMGLAGETGKAPQELAEALYFIRSAGLDGKDALDALEMSAKGAAAGLGSTIQVADAVTSAMNGYAEAGLSAAEATDVLVMTAREGKAEASQLAPQFGRLVPIAAELGVSFDQVGAGLAFFSRSSGDAALSATNLNGILTKLIAPGDQGAEALKRAGLSLEDLRKTIQEKDLLAALLQLKGSLEANGMTFSDFSTDTQFLTGALQLTANGGKEARAVFDSLADSAGATEEAFSTWAESMGAQNAQAWARMQAALIQFGDTLAPIASDIISFAADIVSAFADMPDWAQKATLGFLGLLAALGPALSVIGNITKVVGTGHKLLDTFATSLTNAAAASINTGTATTSLGFSLGRLGKQLAVGGAVLGGAVLLAQQLEKIDDAASKRRTEDVFGFDKLVANLGRNTDAAEQHVQRFVSLADHFGFLEDAVKRVADTNVDLAEKLISGAEAAGIEDEKIQALRQVLTDHKDAATAAAGGTSELTGELEGQPNAAAAAMEALAAYTDALRAQTDPLFGAVDALRANQDAQLAVTAAQEGLNAAITEFGPSSAEAAEAERELTEAHNNAAGSALDVHSAMVELKHAVDQGTVSVDSARGMLNNWVAQGLISQQTADVMALAFAGARDRANELGMTDPNVHISATDNASFVVRTLRDQLDYIAGKTFTVGVKIVGQNVGAVLPGGVKVFHAGGVVPGQRGQEVAAILQAGERVLALDDPLNAAMSGHVTSAAGYASGGTTVVSPSIHFHGPVTQDSVRWVAQQVNRGIERNLVNNRGRRL